MKKMILVMAALLIGSTSATAQVKRVNKDLRITKRYSYTQPIMFVERGVEFLVFPNGEFDFNTKMLKGKYNYSNYRSSKTRRGSINASVKNLGKRVSFTKHNGRVLVQHDRLGRVKRIGNVFINYDSTGRVKHIGSIQMKYRHRLLKRVGGLSIQYNRWGEIVGTHGYINRHNRDCGIVGCSSYHIHKSYADTWNKSQIDWNEDYYYYKRGGKTLKSKKHRTR